MITDPIRENRDSIRRLKFTLYPAFEMQRSIDQAYSNYCQSIRDSDKLVKPVSKSSWILSLVRSCIQQMEEPCNEYSA